MCHATLQMASRRSTSKWITQENRKYSGVVKMGRGCVHLNNFKERHGIKTYQIIHSIFVVCDTPEAKRSKARSAKCHVCEHIGPILHACLICIFFGCHKHIREHGKKHDLSMELIYGQVYCSQCRDYIYDTELDQVALTSKMRARVCRKRLFQWTSWEPEEDEKDAITYKSKVVCLYPESTIGLRGLLNLGNTCFMNCIVQALMHTPLLRDYFMTERHKCDRIIGSCLVCELAKLFQEFYTEARMPLTLNHLLHLIWTNATHLADSKQQDAHEFFIATLNVLHTHFTVNMTPPERALAEDFMNCPCIIHRIFTGGLQSDLECQNCKGISTKIEPAWDLSLELSPHNGRPPSSLVDCLERYTTAEHLGPNVQRMCSHCHSFQQSTKRLTMRTLPIVVSFHLKRLHRDEKGMEKISTLISFPETLDMAPFMSHPQTSQQPLKADYRYSLFAVINHKGNEAGGHYTAYVRQQRDYWYKCDDHVITRANLKEVLDSEGYLLFYHKHVLDYA